MCMCYCGHQWFTCSHEKDSCVSVCPEKNCRVNVCPEKNCRVNVDISVGLERDWSVGSEKDSSVNVGVCVGPENKCSVSAGVDWRFDVLSSSYLQSGQERLKFTN